MGESPLKNSDPLLMGVCHLVLQCVLWAQVALDAVGPPFDFHGTSRGAGEREQWYKVGGDTIEAARSGHDKRIQQLQNSLEALSSALFSEELERKTGRYAMTLATQSSKFATKIDQKVSSHGDLRDLLLELHKLRRKELDPFFQSIIEHVEPYCSLPVLRMTVVEERMKRRWPNLVVEVEGKKETITLKPGEAEVLLTVNAYGRADDVPYSAVRNLKQSIKGIADHLTIDGIVRNQRGTNIASYLAPTLRGCIDVESLKRVHNLKPLALSRGEPQKHWK